MSKVMCVGELLIDFVCTDKNIDLSNGENFIKKAGGAPANVAVAIKKMGAESFILGLIGDDPFGAFLENTLAKYEVNTDNLLKSKVHNTTLAFVSLKNNGERDFKFNRGADEHYMFDEIDKKVLVDCNVFHFGSATAFLGGELEKTYYTLLDYAVENNKIVCFDPNYRDSLFGNNKQEFATHCINFIKKCHVLKVSEEEAMIITREKDIEISAKMLVKYGAKFVIVTLGSKGAILCHGNNIEYLPSKPVDMLDATGAGDAFIGTVIAQIAKNCKESSQINARQLKSFIEFGNKVGAITVQKYGALDAIPYFNEV